MNKLLFVLSWTLICFLILPIFVIVYMSFSSDLYFTFDNTFSLRWYYDLVYDDKWLKSLKNSLIFGILSMIISLFVGVPAALWLHSTKQFRHFVVGLVLSPMIIPPMISAVSWFFFYTQIGLNNSFLEIIISHSILGIPFVVISVLASMTNYNKTYEKCARICGATHMQIFTKITLPVILPGILVGAILSFISSFDELIAVLFLSTYDTGTLPLLMWSSMRENISPVILAVTSLLVLFSFVSIVSVQILKK